MIIYVFKVKCVDEIGHMLSPPVRQLFGGDVIIPFSGKVLLCVMGDQLLGYINMGRNNLPRKRIIDE